MRLFEAAQISEKVTVLTLVETSSEHALVKSSILYLFLLFCKSLPLIPLTNTTYQYPAAAQCSPSKQKQRGLCLAWELPKSKRATSFRRQPEGMGSGLINWSKTFSFINRQHFFFPSLSLSVLHRFLVLLLSEDDQGRSREMKENHESKT